MAAIAKILANGMTSAEVDLLNRVLCGANLSHHEARPLLDLRLIEWSSQCSKYFLTVLGNEVASMTLRASKRV
jgi:hypothetical protein